MNTRPILPVTAGWYNNFDEALEYAPYMDYYVKDIMSLEGWESLRPIPTTQTWCVLNSFNMPSGRYVTNYLVKHDVNDICHDPIVVCLQGAGDILLSVSIVYQVECVCYVGLLYPFIYKYNKFDNLLESDSHLEFSDTFDVGQPTDLVYRTMPQENNHFVFYMHYPTGCRALLYEAIDRGWDHYDWKGFIGGMKILPEYRKIYLELTEEDREKADEIAKSIKFDKVIGIHAFASNDDRSCPEVIKIAENYQKTHPDTGFVLFGGNAESYLDIGILNLAGKLTYRETAAMLPHLDGLIAVDSVVMHMAAMTDIPVLGLYKWSPTTWAGPRNESFSCLEMPKEKDIIDWIERI